MGQFISKPVKPEICTAVQFDTSTHTADHAFSEIEAFVGEHRAQRVTPLGTTGFSIYHDGIKHWLEVKPGQYVLKTDGGFFYPVDPGVFEHTYVPLVDGQGYSLDVVVEIDESGIGRIVETKEVDEQEPPAPADPPAPTPAETPTPKKAPTPRKRKAAAQPADTLL